MLASILESKSKANLLAFFLVNPERSLYIGELERRIGGKDLQADLRAMAKLGIIGSSVQKGKRYYSVNVRFPQYQQLKNSLQRHFNYEDELIKNIKKLGGLKYAVLSGIFTGEPKLECDILLVGELSKRQLDEFVLGAEKLMGQEINYAVMDEQEFAYRKGTYDRFMKNIYENRHLVVLNKIRA